MEFFHLDLKSYIKLALFHITKSRKKNWEQYYSTNEKFQNYTDFHFNKSTEITVTQNPTYVFCCYFNKINKKVISITNLATTILIEQCYFSSITSNNYGGAILCQNIENCVIASVCGVRCGTPDYGQFAYVHVISLQTCKNQIYHSSITLTQSRGCYTLRHNSGNASCYGVNVSHNNVQQVSGILIYEPKTTAKISFSSFRNNTADPNYICLYCHTNQHFIDYTNVIENKQMSPDDGIIYAESNARMIMNHCSVYGNDPGPGKVFCQQFFNNMFKLFNW